MKAVRCVCIAVCAAVCFSCNIHTRNTAFTGQLDTVDALIAQGNANAAVGALDALTKKAYSPFNRLGIVRRYLLLGKHEKAESFLKKSLKKLPDNAELAAAYVWLLLEKAQTQLYAGSPARTMQIAAEAERFTGVLASSAYRSLATETVLLKTAALSASAGDNSVFFDPALIPEYVSAANAAGNQVFLRNAAVLYAADGLYRQAQKLHPSSVAGKREVLFWSSLAYDGGNYLQCVTDIENSGLAADAELGILAADAYMQLGEMEHAGDMWQMLVSLPGETSPAVLLNAAKYAETHTRASAVRSLLERLVRVYPEYVPGLVQYGQYVLASFREKPESSFIRAVRSAGLNAASVVDAAAENRIPVADADMRFQKALALNPDPELQVAYLKFKWAAAGDFDARRRLADIWKLLEQNYSSGDGYPPYIVRYAAWVFLAQGKYAEAEKLLYSHILQQYGSSDVLQVCGNLLPWEAEYAGYIKAVQYKEYAPAIALYEQALKDSDEAAVALNLGDLYAVNGRRDKALAVYRNAAGKTADVVLKSDIYYRIAVLLAGAGDKKNAVLSVQYSISLDPSNTKARLLHTELNRE